MKNKGVCGYPTFILIGSVWALLICVSFGWLIYQDIFLVDFTTFYNSVGALWNDVNPYQVLQYELRGVTRQLPVNLNPPVFLMCFLPLYYFSYKTAEAIWFFILILLAFASFCLARKYGCSDKFWNRNGIYFKFIFITSFSTIMGLAIGQIGPFIAFWILLGYHFYQSQSYHRCALCWGFITACKFFPAVLLLFCIQQGKWRLAFWYIFYGLILFFLPILIFGVDLFYKYDDMISRVMWYGDSWNASFFGLIGRLFIDNHNIQISLRPYHLIWLSVATPILLFYLFQRQLAAHFSFLLALVLMLILSPFGWMYYFFLLFIVLLNTAEKAEKSNDLWLWFFALVLMNFPIDYIAELHQQGLIQRLLICSAHFYGLVLLLILLLRPTRNNQQYFFSSIRLPLYLNQFSNLLMSSVIIFAHFYKYF